MAEIDSAALSPIRTARPSGGCRQWAAAVLGVLLVVATVRLTVAAPLQVTGDSMSPTLQQGSVVLLRLGASGVDRGDLVAFDSPDAAGQVVKRVVGVAGDSVVVRDAVLEVNGVPVDEPYVDHESIDALYTPTVEVPAGEVYVLGDNRARSTDSRSYGTVSLDAVNGTVLAQIWPGD